MVRRRAGSRAAVALLALAAGHGAATLRAQSAAAVPPALEGVGVTQKLDAALPLDDRFLDEAGREVRLGEFFDGERPVLLSLVYYRCPMLCNLVLDGVVRTLSEMDWTPGGEFEVLTVSIDPDEGPELARAKKESYLTSYGRDDAGAGWHFLTGRPAAIAALADSVGFRYRYLEQSGEFAHPAVLFVITPAGRVSRYLFGIEHEPRDVRLSLVEAAAGRIGSVVDSFLLYCYRYDERSGRYTPLAWRIMQLAGLSTALALGAVLGACWLREARSRRRVAR